MEEVSTTLFFTRMRAIKYWDNYKIFSTFASESKFHEITFNFVLRWCEEQETASLFIHWTQIFLHCNLVRKWSTSIPWCSRRRTFIETSLRNFKNFWIMEQDALHRHLWWGLHSFLETLFTLSQHGGFYDHYPPPMKGGEWCSSLVTCTSTNQLYSSKSRWTELHKSSIWFHSTRNQSSNKFVFTASFGHLTCHSTDLSLDKQGTNEFIHSNFC